VFTSRSAADVESFLQLKRSAAVTCIELVLDWRMRPSSLLRDGSAQIATTFEKIVCPSPTAISQIDSNDDRLPAVGGGRRREQMYSPNLYSSVCRLDSCAIKCDVRATKLMRSESTSESLGNQETRNSTLSNELSGKLSSFSYRNVS